MPEYRLAQGPIEMQGIIFYSFLQLCACIRSGDKLYIFYEKLKYDLTIVLMNYTVYFLRKIVYESVSIYKNLNVCICGGKLTF